MVNEVAASLGIGIIGLLCSKQSSGGYFAGIVTELLDVTNGDQIKEVVTKHQDINVVFNCAG